MFILDLLNGMYRVESDNSVDADEPIMKHLMEGGVTILKQLERKKQVKPYSIPRKYNREDMILGRTSIRLSNAESA